MLPATSYVEIEAADGYEAAAKIAEATWSSAPGGWASVAVIDDTYPDPPAPVSDTISATYPDSLRAMETAVAVEGWNAETLAGNTTKITYDPNEPLPGYQLLNDTSVGLGFHWYLEFDAPEWAYGIDVTHWYSDGMSNDMVLYMETADGRRVKFGSSQNTGVGDPVGDTVIGQVDVGPNHWPKEIYDPYQNTTRGGAGRGQWERIVAPNVRPGRWSVDPWWDGKQWFGNDTAEGFMNVTLLPGHEQEITIPAFTEDLELTMTWNDPTQNLDMTP
jgi:hypothetical protein